MVSRLGSVCIYTENDEVIERDLYERGASEGWLKINESYNNVYNSLKRFPNIIKMLNMKIAYGYICITRELYLRSCFFTREDKVIDTNRHFYERLDRTVYKVFHEMDMYEYIDIIVKSKSRDLSMIKELSNKERYFRRYAKSKGIKIRV